MARLPPPEAGFGREPPARLSLRCVLVASGLAAAVLAGRCHLLAGLGAAA